MRTATPTVQENFDHDELTQARTAPLADNVSAKAEKAGKRPDKEIFVKEATVSEQAADEELGDGWNHLTVPDGQRARVVRSIRSTLKPEWKHEEIRYFDEDYNFGVALTRALDCVQNAFHPERTGGEGYERMPEFNRGKTLRVTVEII